MEVEFFEKANRMLIKRFPLFLYSSGSLYKILDLLKDDFFIALRKSEPDKKVEGDSEADYDFKVDVSLIGKRKCSRQEANEFFKEMMNSLISFENGVSLLQVEDRCE